MKNIYSYISKIQQKIIATIEFKQRIWIVNILKKNKNDGSIVICEDNFNYPFEWMVLNLYTSDMLKLIDKMKTSETKTIYINNEIHHVMRVK